MGRPERPLPPEIASTAGGRLALYLRQGRRNAIHVLGEEVIRGIPYAELARRTGYGASTLQRAASGQRVPAHDVVWAYADACGLDLDEVHRLWQEARRQAHRGPAEARAVPVDMVHDQAELGVALVDLHERSGAPSVRTMERRARRAGAAALTRSGIQRTLARQRIPSSPKELAAFLLACQVPEDEREKWARAWERACRQRAGERAAIRQRLRRLEAQAAGTGADRVTAARAIGLLQDFGYIPIERYQAFTTSWTVRCMSCSTPRRVRLSDLVQNSGGCTCNEAVRPETTFPPAAGDNEA